jgi:transposase
VAVAAEVVHGFTHADQVFSHGFLRPTGWQHVGGVVRLRDSRTGRRRDRRVNEQIATVRFDSRVKSLDGIEKVGQLARTFFARQIEATTPQARGHLGAYIPSLFVAVKVGHAAT